MSLQISASFTALPVARPLRFWFERLGMDLEVQFSDHNQVIQQLLDPSSATSRNADANVLLVRSCDIAPTDPEAAETELEQACAQAAPNLKAKTLVVLCPHPDSTSADSDREIALAQRLNALPNVDAIAVHAWPVAEIPNDPFDAIAERVGQVPYTEIMFCALGTAIARHLHRDRRNPHKVIAVDADNTLWLGVVGEDDVQGLRIDESRRRLQEILLEKREQGFLLAISSKNEAADVERVLDQHPDMILKRSDFTSLKVNWKPKSENLRQLAGELGVGMDSILFLDDNPAEVAEVAARCPAVTALTVPLELAPLEHFIKHCWAFDVGEVTSEDTHRAASYAAQGQRAELRDRAASFVDFLNSLKLDVRIDPLTELSIARVAQLTSRTNQFNACKRMMSEADIRQIMRSSDQECLTIRVSDRFGDYGVVGALMTQTLDQTLLVTGFMLSCRALGKGVERCMIRELGQFAKRQGCHTVAIKFKESERNDVCAQFLRSIGAQSINGRYEIRAADAQELSPFPSEGSVSPQAIVPSESSTATFSAELMAQILSGWSDPRKLAETLAAERRPRPALPEGAIPASTPLEKRLTAMWEAVLGLEGIGVADTFTALGGRSLQLVQVHARLVKDFKVEIPLTDLFELPTIRALAARLGGDSTTSHTVSGRLLKERDPGEPIAIVGMALRVPGAESVEQFWSNLCNGVESIQRFTDEELASAGVDVAEVRQDPKYVPVKGCMADSDQFDAAFFGILPKEAKQMDPQQRVFLELAWEALERAGYNPDTFDGRIGLWAGAYFDTYLVANLLTDKAFHANWIPAIQVGSLQTELGNDKDYLATRVSFKLNLRGPSMTVQTACSTSMVAISQAVQSLRAGESDMAMAGGVTITLPEKKGYYYTEDGMLSKDGRVCTFGDEASGTVFGNGTGIVVLKRLSEALADGDHIHGVIRGAALNNDGGVKHSYTAPSVDGQVDVIAMAHQDAGIAARSVGYIEAHGTGTPLGDPIEVAALTKLFGSQTNDKQFCALGSLKPNVGHLDVASGVCGVIKAALILENQQLPPLLHFKNPNPKIDFANSPFYVNRHLQEWASTADTPRRAGVSSFGVGGTNGHVVLEEAPQTTSSETSKRPAQLLMLSARTHGALDAASQKLAAWASESESPLADAAFTLAVGRKAFAKRRAVTASDLAHLHDQLTAGKVKSASPRRADPPLSFLFPGQGAQHVGMARELYECEAVFRDHIDFCATTLMERIGGDLREVLYPDTTDEAATDRLKQTLNAQPAIFVIETGLAKLWQSWGLVPQRMIGHSVGEFAAACVAGVFSLEDGLHILAERGRLMGDLPGGAMLSVRLSEEAIQPYLTEADLAAVNGKELCVLAGSHEIIARVEAQLNADGVTTKHLHTSHGFHSRMMEPVIAPFAKVIAQATLKAPSIPILSTVTGEWLKEAEATDPVYWAKHLRQPVRFYQTVRALAAEEEGQLMLEVGPGQTLATLARQSIGREGEHQFFATCKHAASEASDFQHLLETAGHLWCHGAEIDWQAFYGHERRHRVVLPTYPFERKRHWVDPSPMDDKPSLPTVPLATSSIDTAVTSPPMPSIPIPPSRSERIAAAMREILSELSDIPEAELDGSASFLELGFDSLLLTQVSKAFQDAFSVKVTMRQLLDELPGIDALVAHLDQVMDPTAFAAEVIESPPPPAAVAATPPTADGVVPANQAPTQAPAAMAPVMAAPAVAMMPGAPPVTLGSDLSHLISQQMTLMQQQLTLLQGGAIAQAAPATLPQAQVLAPPPAPRLDHSPPATLPTPAVVAAPEEMPPEQAAHGPYKPINRNRDTGLTEKQDQFIADLTKRYNAKTRRSKERTQKYRHCFADPRTANGFNRLWKEMCYQLLVERAKGSRLFDIDGNEYIDIVNGFGPNFLGHSPDFIIEALHEQLDKTIAVGPQAEFAGETAELVCDLIGMDRVCFLNTGSEAVQAAMRVARTITGRDKIIVFGKDYHGNFDEVLVRGANRNGKFKSLPIAPGIPNRAVSDILVLDYGTEESLEIIRQQAHECAAVMVEPMQSRRPDFQPAAFIKELRKVTAETGCLFVFDEVITGFRTGPGGAQEYYGIKADLATYGKVIGSGMPVGLIAGKREYMDTFDGGHWTYGDDSFPEAPVTFFAGTFVRHPLAIAAVRATAKFLKAQPRSFWDTVYAKANRMAGTIDAFFQEHHIGMHMAQFSSQMYIKIADDEKYAGLFFCLMRDKGVFMLEGLPNYLTASHTDEDVDYVIDAAKESVAEMMAAGFFEESGLTSNNTDSLGKLQGPSRLMETALQVAPVTAAQQEIWLACHLDAQASCAYNEATTLTMDGPVEIGRLRAALNEIIQRHDALRATFSKDGQHVHFAESLSLELPEVDLSGLPTQEQQDRLAAYQEAEATTPLDLSTGPLIRGFVVKLSERKHVLFLTAHHIVCDGWSYNVLLEELSALYGAKCRNALPELANVVPFSRYATAKGQQRGKAAANTALDFWLKEYASFPPPINLPTDRPFPNQPTFAGNTERHTVPLEVVKAFKRVGAKQKCTAYQSLLGAFEVLLHKLTRQSDFVIGTPAAGQTIEEESDIIGHCVNFLPLRATVDDSHSFNEHLAGVRSRVMNAFDHQDFTYGELLPKLTLPRVPGRMPLVEIEFNVERTDYHDEFHGLKTHFDSVPKRFVNFPIFINIVDGPEGLVIDCDYKTDLFDPAAIHRWLLSFEQVIKELSQHPEQAIADLNILAESERQTLLHDWNGTEETFKTPKCLHQFVEHQVTTSPETVAVSQGNLEFTYGELNERANAIAAQLQDIGAAPDRLVGVFLDRHPTTAAALLGVLKSGCAYVPLDPGFPAERLAMMIEDAAPLAILTTPELRDRLPETDGTIIELNDDRRAEPVTSSVNETHLAYVIYTSGSTGKPKGVQIEHRAVVNFLNSMRAAPGMEVRDVLVAVTTLCFDISILEFFLPLVCGARVEIASREQAINPEELAALIAQCGATHLQATPVTWRMLSESGWVPPRGFRMLCGGEPLPLDLAQTLAQPGVELWNLYGPTETTIWSTIARVEPQTTLVHIGRPIANTSIYILDEAMRLVPTGVAGRLFIGGHGLARGYANRPKLSAEKFVSHPFESKLSSRVYDTGDLARYRSDGTIECLGRSDNQVKFNGYRIELGDIETTMRSHPSVADAAVKLFEQAGAQQLLGYVIVHPDRSFDDAALREHLKAKLPSYMVPGNVLSLESFPLTPNRKVDRKALPTPDLAVGPLPSERAAPRDAVERQLLALWQEILGKDDLGVTDDLFDLGGHSMTAVRLIARIEESFGMKVPIATLFREPTIERLSNKLRRPQETTGAVIRGITPRDSLTVALPPSYAQERMYFLDQLEPGLAVYNIPIALRLLGDLVPDILSQCIDRIISRHESLRTHFEDPDGDPLQVIDSPTTGLMTVDDVSSKVALEAIIQEEASGPFNLSASPLIRVRLLRLTPREHVLLVVAHHTVFDGISQGVFLRELKSLYEALLAGKSSPLQELSIQYADYALWQRHPDTVAQTQAKLAYWTDTLGGKLPICEWPTDHPRPPIQAFEGANVFFTLPKDLVESLTSLGREEGATLFMALLAGFKCLLFQRTSQPDVIVGTPVSNRDQSEVKDLIGCFVNTIALRTRLTDEASFRDLLQQERDVCLEGFAHQDVPFERVMDALKLERDMSRSPIFQILFAFENVVDAVPSMNGLTLEEMTIASETSRTDLSVWIRQSDDGIAGAIEYASHLYEASTIQSLVQEFESLLRKVLENPDGTLGGKQVSEQPPTRTAFAPPQLTPAKSVQLQSGVVEEIAKIWQDLLGHPTIGTTDNFFDVGGHSLLLMRLLNRLKKAFDVPIKLGDLFRYTTIEAQAQLCVRDADNEGPTVIPDQKLAKAQPVSSQDIAVVGMSGRFPGASDLETFWENLRNGVESITDLTDEQLAEAGVPESLVRDPNYVRRGALIDHAESFDHQLFGISPREVELMDPQHRVFLEESFRALESAGYDPDRYDGKIGVFAGAGQTSMQDPEGLLPSDYYPAMTGKQPDYLTTRVAYRLNLRGPSLTVQTGCSTSLVAVQTACQSLLSGQCDMALAGGISLTLPQGQGYLFQDGMMMAPDGHCRAFDANAEGTVFTQGVGVVVLKRLQAALQDGDEIHAVIKSSAINNDGGGKVGFTAPSIEGQAQVILDTLEQQDIDPGTISLIETHGTGTPLGDPIEFAALRQAFESKTAKRGFCALGALKNNVGHMDAAAGIGSFIKAVLALKHRELPPTINYQSPNSEMELDVSPFYVTTTRRAWTTDGAPRRAGVSSFGIGGTNAHVILEEAPVTEPSPRSNSEFQLLPYSAKSKESLETTLESGLTYLDTHPDISLADAAYTLQTGRKQFRHRAAAVNGQVVRGEASTRQLVFLFPGQGSSYHHMARGLYESQDVFRTIVDQCDQIIHAALGWRLSEDLFGEESVDWTRTDRAQPALFVIEFALARLWMHWGLEPTAMVGHSLGEYVAACLADVFTMEDALSLVCERGRLMQGMEPGAMLSVSAPRHQVEDHLRQFGRDQLGLAVENSPQSQVVSGPEDLVKGFAEALDHAGISSRHLKTSHAFHSSMMESAAAAFHDVVSRVPIKSPQRPFVSNVSGDWITAEQAQDPAYWSEHLRATVKFSPAIKQIIRDVDSPLFLEVGPGTTLTTLVRQHDRQQLAIASMRHLKDEHTDEETLLLAVGALWTSGIAIDWKRVFDHRGRKRVALPGYAFQRTRYEVLQPSKTKNTDKQGLLEVLWRKRIVRPKPVEDGTWIIFDEPNHSLTKAIGCAEAVTILPGTDWRQPLQGLRGDVRVVFGWALSRDGSADDYEAFQRHCVDPLVELVRFLDGLSLPTVRLTIVTRDVFDIGGTEQVQTAMASLIGYCHCIPQEYVNMSCRHIDLGGSELGRNLSPAVMHSGRDTTLAIRAGRCYAPDYARWSAEISDEGAELLVAEGAYIITGGLGLIGMGFAEMLATKYRARLVLVGRLGGGEPGPLESESQDERFDTWRAAGAEVVVYRADVTSIDQLDELFSFAQNEFGKIDGLIHAAGMVKATPLKDQTPDTRRDTQKGKVEGGLAMADSLRDAHLTFCLMVSSVSTVLGGIGYGAYASGNAVLDAIALREDGMSSTRWISLGLDAVSEDRNENALSVSEASHLLELALKNASVPTRLVVSQSDLEKRLTDWVYGANTLVTKSEGPTASSSLAETTDTVEERMQSIWQEVLKMNRVEADDHFFELGGDSVLAIPLFHKIRETFGVALPIATLFEAPTPSRLAEQVKSSPAFEAEQQSNGSSQRSADHGTNGTNGSHPSVLIHPGIAKSMVTMAEGDDSKPAIFFAHPGGGSIVFYHDMVLAMNHEHPMYGIESPLLSQSTLDLTGMESIEAIADKYVALIQEVQPNGPYILAGYSFGGLVSLEMARHLMKDGQECRLLVFDTPNPQANVQERNLGQRLAYQWSQGGSVGQRLKTISHRAIRGAVERAQATSIRSKARTLNASQTPSTSGKILNVQILELYDGLTEAYHPAPFDGTMHLFVADDPGDKFCYDDDLGWSDVILGGLEVTGIPGAHLTLFEKENIGSLVQAIEGNLQAYDEERSGQARDAGLQS